MNAKLYIPGGRFQCVLFLTGAAWAGCSGTESTTVPVSGVVKLPSGQPLPGGQILFQPTGEAAQPARTIIAADGHFTLSTFEPGDGAVPGEHKVVIMPAVPDEALDDPAAVARHRATVHRRYQTLETTPLVYTVKDDGSENRFEITLNP